MTEHHLLSASKLKVTQRTLPDLSLAGHPRRDKGVDELLIASLSATPPQASFKVLLQARQTFQLSSLRRRLLPTLIQDLRPK